MNTVYVVSDVQSDDVFEFYSKDSIYEFVAEFYWNEPDVDVWSWTWKQVVDCLEATDYILEEKQV